MTSRARFAWEIDMSISKEHLIEGVHIARHAKYGTLCANAKDEDKRCEVLVSAQDELEFAFSRPIPDPVAPVPTGNALATQSPTVVPVTDDYGDGTLET